MLGRVRFHGFDYLRVIAMAAVIYIHGCDTNSSAESMMRWLGFPVPCFLVMAAFLTQWSQLQRPVGYAESIRKRCKRLVYPYLAWSLVYIVVRWAKSRATGQVLDADWFGIMFWGDAAHQLYFVPLLLYSLVFWLAMMQLGKRNPLWLFCVCLFGFALAVFIENPLNASLPDNRYFVAKSLIWFPIGMTIALATNYFQSLRNGLPAILGLAALGSFVVPDLVTYWITVLLFVLSMAITIPPPTWLGNLARLSFGIYLAHVLMIESIQFGFTKAGFSLDSLAMTLLVIVASAALSVACCVLLDRSERTSWLVR